MNEAYTTLGVSSDATQDEIKSAYRKLAKQYHPDLHPGDEACAAKMNEINAAYDQISDPDKRKMYDASQTSPFGAYGPASSYGPFGSYGSSSYGPFGSYGSDDNGAPYGSYENPFGSQNGQDPFSAWFNSAFSQGYYQTSERSDQEQQPRYRFYSYPFGTTRRPRTLIGRLIRTLVICWLISFLFRALFGVGFYFLWL